ncbi:MAG TPA: hypothetical protein VF526_15640 [Solirubrobacteraceae bacterium]|jgi:hypothetical protein
MNLYTCMDALLCEMEDFVREYHGYDSPSWRCGDFAAGALLEFKGRRGDGRLDHWTVEDLREFLLGWFPRTVYADEDLQRDVPDCVTVFFRFLAARGSLNGDSLDELEAACESLRGQFLSSCSDPGRWNPSKVWLSLIAAPAPVDAQDAPADFADELPQRQRSVGGIRRRSSSASRAARTEASTPASRRTLPGLR